MGKKRKTPERPRDVNELAKRIVDMSVGDAPEDEDIEVDERAVARGKARAENLTPKERSEIAKKAAEARWDRTDGR